MRAMRHSRVGTGSSDQGYCNTIYRSLKLLTWAAASARVATGTQLGSTGALLSQAWLTVSQAALWHAVATSRISAGLAQGLVLARVASVSSSIGAGVH